MHRLLGMVAMLLLACAASGQRADARNVIHVDANASLPPHDGSDWCHAFVQLHEALAVATSGATIRVADGTYSPDTAVLGDPRAAAFALMNGVTIEGGYAGCGALNPNERRPAVFETILSGDVGSIGVAADNCYHVVVASGVDATTTLDGLTITSGNADGVTGPNQGGGMLISSGSPTLRECTLWQNSAQYGGGIFVFGGQPRFIRTNFDYNDANASGGALYTYSTLAQPGPTVTECVFHDNTATGSGGAVRNYDSAATFTDCTFNGNVAGYGGAAVANGGQGGPCFVRCVFEANHADTFFAAYDCFGGGMHNTDTSQPTLESCVFADNAANSMPPAVSYGGAVANGGGAGPSLVNCTLSDNYANVGRGLFNSDQSSSDVTNSILWNGGDEIVNAGSATVAVSYSVVAPAWPGEGNIVGDPLLDGWRLSAASPCINTGDPGFVPSGAPDVEGRARVLCGRVDIGAHEFGIGDFDCDRVIDVDDFLHWGDCATGPSRGPADSGCEVFDYESDGDVDIEDFAAFQAQFASG
ncbi:MAG: right-handed parallel beta-helix repeat-containing protein [Phycisphaerae bacterium]|nr:right-handed parallel beta-helix repeat-containing protein [Phycisphaerae bacterium]